MWCVDFSFGQNHLNPSVTYDTVADNKCIPYANISIAFCMRDIFTSLWNKGNGFLHGSEL
jgi:hypothetical protein